MKLPARKTIRIRLVLWFVLMMGIVTIISDYFLYQNYKKSLSDAIDDTLYLVAEEIEHAMLKSSPETWRREITNVKDEFINSRFFIQVLEFRIDKNEPPRKIVNSGVLSGCLANLGQKTLSFDTHPPRYLNGINKSLSQHPIRIIIFPFKKGRDSNRSYVVQVGTSLTKLYQSLDNLLSIILFAAPIILFLSAYGGFLIISKAINPVKSIVETVKKITTDDLSHRIDPQGRDDEIGELVLTFNHMLERLEGSILQIKQFSNDVSHELKTPLAVILGEIELVIKKNRPVKDYKTALINIYEVTKKLESIINNLLILSQMDFQKNLYTFKRTPLYEVLMNCLKRIEIRAKEKKITLKILKIDPVFIDGEQSLLYSLIMNLADNAIKYSDKDKTITISLTEKNDFGILSIKDNGIGIPGESIPYIFDRFYQVDQSRSSGVKGFGLGLAIVSKIASLHHAKIEIKSKLRHGTEFRVLFPLSSD